jgi:DNA-binding transcriptional ArsR family regulator
MVTESPRANPVAPATGPVGPATGPVVLRDPRAIKALAHSARLAVLDEFFGGRRRLTATECAQIAGLSASAMSYHLRALEKWGIIRRSETTGDGRERPWEAAGERLEIDSAEPRATAAGVAMLIARMLDRQRADTLSWISHQDELTAPWYDSIAVSSGVYWLTHEEARQLSAQIGEVVGAFESRRSMTEPPVDSRRVRVSYTVVPVRSSTDGQPED